MSTAAHTVAGTQEAPAPIGERDPGVVVALRVELAKLSSQVSLRIVLALCAIVPAVFAIVMRVASSRPADTLFGRWAGTSGFATSLTVLNWAAAYGAPLLAGLFAGDMFASEDRHDTWKTILSRSTSRSRLFVGKALAAALTVWVGFGLIAVVSIVAGMAAVGSAALVGLSGQLIPAGHALGLVVASWALSLLASTAFVALGLLLSIATRSGSIAMLGSLVVAIVLQLLEAIAAGPIVRSVLLSTPFDAWHVLFTDSAATSVIVQSIATSPGYTALFGGAAWYLLRRRDFAGVDAVPARRRRATMRIGVALAALSAVLVGLSGVGPTALTANRLGDSLATTFGNLAEVRYQWQTGAKADTNIPWHATCTRGGTAAGVTPSTATGAGDDWACTIVDTRASDGAGPTVLDVTLKANGCYQVQSPPGARSARSTSTTTRADPSSIRCSPSTAASEPP
jgi:ABC-2 type transport system permease protein